MRAFASLMMVLVVSLALTGCDPCKENVGDKLGDWVSTIGKDGIEKDKVLAGRKGDRAAACAKKKGGELKKKMGL